jgi:hypothetical protein
MNSTQTTPSRQTNNQPSQSTRPTGTQKPQHDHDQYDDGLVHNHGWASSAR